MGPIGFVGREHHRGASPDGVAHQGVEQIPALGVEAGVGFVEQPQGGMAGHEHGQSGAPALAGRESPDGDRGEPAIEAQVGEGGWDLCGMAAGGAHPEADVVLHREIVIEPGGVTDQPDPPAHSPAVTPEIDPEHHRFAARHREQPGTDPQQAGLARAVRALHQDHLARRDVEVDAGECGEAAQESDGCTEADGGCHGFRGHGRGGGDLCSMRGPIPKPCSKRRHRSRYRDGVDLRRAVGGLGRTLIAAGVLILLFVVYQLFGTNIAEARSQTALRKQFQKELAATPPTTATTAGSTPTTVDQSNIPPAAPEGDGVAIIKIPKLGVEKVVVEGVGVDDLKKGPGHYPGTPQPGQPGNAAIAGHRTTYGAPFFRLNELNPGDTIFVTTHQGQFQYQVHDVHVVAPTDTSVLKPTSDNRLTLTTCNPRFSATQRLVLVASLQGPASAPPVTAPTTGNPTTPSTLPGDTAAAPSAGLSGQSKARTPAVVWGLAAAAVWLVAWLVGKAWRRWPAYLLGTPVFLVVLYVFFENFSRLLPANY